MANIYQRVRELLGTSVIRRNDYYDAKVKETTYAAGDWVWCLYQRRRHSLSPKWQSHYKGQYMVVKVLSSYNIVIQKSKRIAALVVHYDK